MIRRAAECRSLSHSRMLGGARIELLGDLFGVEQQPLVASVHGMSGQMLRQPAERQTVVDQQRRSRLGPAHAELEPVDQPARSEVLFAQATELTIRQPGAPGKTAGRRIGAGYAKLLHVIAADCLHDVVDARRKQGPMLRTAIGGTMVDEMQKIAISPLVPA